MKSSLISRQAAAWLVAAVACASLPTGAAPAPSGVAGVVTRVSDGDTLQFTPTGKPPITVRLRDIDAPEICQPWGPEAKRALSDLALNKPAVLRASGHDSYGRTVGVVLVDELNLGTQMVEDGNAWSLRTRFDQGPLVKQERMSKALGRGFHTQAGKVMPWDFRKTHGPCSEGQAVASLAPSAAPVSTPPAAVQPSAAFKCDGRTHCSQMRSCDEAKYFLAHCPGVTMDGNRDGVPCEKQWCRPGR